MTMRRTIFAALVMQGAWLAPALSAEATAPVCQNSGREYKVGEYACIPACHGQRRLARCDAVQSASATWTFVSDVCPSALLAPSPFDATARPIRAAMTPIPLPIERKM